MKNEFVPYDIAFEMGNLGYDIPCFRYYSKDNMMGSVALESGVDRDKYPLDAIRAPLYQQAFRWFRERGYVTFDRPKLDSIGVEPARLKFAIDIAECKYGGMTKMELMNTYEEAELACLRKLIEIVKEKRDENNND